MNLKSCRVDEKVHFYFTVEVCDATGVDDYSSADKKIKSQIATR
jgi:hypothetical protein